jgi:hypothetical protein
MAIDLGLELMARLNRGRNLRPRSLEEIVCFVEAAREMLKCSNRPVTRQDIWLIEQRALQQVRKSALKLAA